MSDPLEVFCCYAREDQEMLAHLKKHLAPLERQGQVTIWSDTNLNAGVEWEKELHQHLESADIILLLISPDFMASDYCYSTEMWRAIARHNERSAQVIPVLLRSTFWQNSPFAKLQMVPTNAKPITSWPDRDDALHDIVMHIDRIVSDLRTKRTQVKIEDSTIATEQQTSTKETPPAPWTPSTPSIQNPSTPILPMPSAQIRPTLSLPLHALIARIKAFEVLRTLRGHQEGLSNAVSKVALSADGLTLASDGCNQTFVWDVRTGGGIFWPKDQPTPFSSSALSADGLVLARGGISGHVANINLWNVQNGQLLRTLTGLTSFFLCDLALSADRQTLACGFDDQTIKLWNIQTGQLLHTLIGHTKDVTSVALSANGQILASGGPDQTIRLWNVQTGQRFHTLRGHTSDVYDVALSADGQILASGSKDQTIKLWNVQTGQLLHTLTGHTHTVTSVALSADGQTLASSSVDGTIKLWGVAE